MRPLLCLALIACGHSAPAPTSHKPSDTGAVTEEEFKAMHAAPTSNAAQLHGQEFQLAGTKAYLSIPPGPGPHPGIVVIHEWWGLNANIEHWADRLASAGWAALAIDLYGGTVATTPDRAMAAMKTVDEAKAQETITAAIDYLKTDPRIAAPKRAVIGWCFGGGWSLQTALHHPELDGAIIYYGMLETDPAKLAGIKARVVGIFGDRDKGIPPAEVDKFEAALKEAGVKADIYRYDAEHAFANPSNPHYDEPSAGNAWNHVLAFLQDLKQ
jgi:carboxymethylenebutenolidase